MSDKIRIYHEALADILCWIDGFEAARGDSSLVRLNIQALRELKSDFYGNLYGKSPDWIKAKDTPNE